MKRVFVVLAVAALAACGTSKPTETGGCVSDCGVPNPTGPTATNSVGVGSGSFEPSDIVIAVGSTVTWTWNTSITHNITFSSSSLTASPDKNSGTFQKAFPNTGTFSYHCTIHALAMSGSVKVQ